MKRKSIKKSRLEEPNKAVKSKKISHSSKEQRLKLKEIDITSVSNKITPEAKKTVVAPKEQEKKTLLLYCPRCKRETDNIVTGFLGQKIRRVRCEVCKSEHNYHRIMALKKRMEDESNNRGETVAIDPQQNYYRLWEELMLGRDPSTARVYNIREKYFENDLINHSVFGIGVVRTVKEDYKIEVIFKNEIKILAHNRFTSSR